MLLRPRRSVAERTYRLSLAATWDMLGNTEHINRTVGLPSITYGETVSDERDFYRPASARVLGLYGVKWKEYPFNWVHQQRYEVLRVFEGTPLRSLVAGVELVPLGDQTRVRLISEVTPRNLLGVPIALTASRKVTGDLVKYADNYASLAGTGAPDPLPRSRTRSAVAVDLLDRLLARLAAMPVEQSLIPLLRRRLADGTDEEVLRMRPFALADAWRADRREVLRLFLYATKAGVLNLTWELICPNCRVPKAECGTMGELRSTFHCDLCGVDIQAELDRYVELRFSVHPAIRQAEDAIYCIGGPINTPHILVQQYLEPGLERRIVLPIGDEEVRVRALRYNATARLERSAEAGEEVLLAYDDAGWQPQRAAYGADEVRLVVRNEAPRPVVAVLERIRWDPQAVTAAQVTAMQEFRDLFASEVLSQDQEIGIQSLTILFTDLKGSTSKYETVGDAVAYGQVRRHFGFLTAAVDRNHGALVKTIGDAVMAVFPSPAEGVRAAMEVQSGVHEFNRAQGIDPGLVIKLGLNHGPAIAINANDRLDYFGRTVNVAARVQRESVGGDVVMTESVFGDPDIERVLTEFAHQAMPFRASLRGIEGEVALVRVMPLGTASAASI